MNKVTYKITINGSRAEMNTLQLSKYYNPRELHPVKRMWVENLTSWTSQGGKFDSAPILESESENECFRRLGNEWMIAFLDFEV